MSAIAFREPRFDEAIELVGESEVFAPTLLVYELVNVAWKKATREPQRRADIQERLIVALTSDIELMPVDPREVLDLALNHGLTGYDASYLWLARELDLPLLSFDEKLIRAVG